MKTNMKINSFVKKGFEIKVKYTNISDEKVALVIMYLINTKSRNKFSDILDVSTKMDTIKKSGEITVLFSGEYHTKEVHEKSLHDLVKTILMSEEGFEIVTIPYEVDIVNVPYNYLEDKGIVDEPFALFVRLGENANYQ